uniref:Mu transposase C-terminal domain-containing protein n=1 Tax=Rahnella sp. ChDrAdgB13 TaxID=1850581 RepID=UPI001AD899D8
MSELFFWVTSMEIASLNAAPSAISSIIRRANKQGWISRQKEGGRGISYEFDSRCLPEEWQKELLNRHYSKVLEQTSSDVPAVVEKTSMRVKSGSVELDLYRKCPALLDKKLGELTDDQKAVADARMKLVCGVLKLMNVGGMKRKAAVELISNSSKNDALSPEMQNAALVANARKGETRKGVCVRSLQKWVSDYMAAKTPGEKMAIIAPGKVKAKPVTSYTWMPEFLLFWRHTNQPTVTMAYEDFEEEWRTQYAGNEMMLSLLPKVDTVRYALNKIPKAERERGRVTGAEYKSMLPFVRRDWSKLPVNGAWIGDGHGMKLEALHPETGKPFKPEITMVIEGPTRVVVGWSLAMSESQVAVGDAIRDAVSKYGIPLIYYSDNGGGEKNEFFDADITGIFSRLGIDHPTGIPGNPQARGIIERLNQEIPKRVAKKFGSYVGKYGDREAQRIYRKQVDSAVNAIEKGKELKAVQKAAIAKVPHWDELIAEIECQIERHNNRPHDSLPMRENGQHWSPVAYRKMLIARDKVEIDYLTSAELHEMFRPEVERKAVKGEVRVFNNRYFSTELSRVEGENVRVCFDIHDPNTVIIRKMDGSWVCDAVWDGNKVDAFAKPYVDQLQEKRHQRRRQRLEQQIARVDEEL